MGWYSEAKIKRMECRKMRAIPAVRVQLIDLRRDLENLAAVEWRTIAESHRRFVIIDNIEVFEAQSQTPPDRHPKSLIAQMGVDRLQILAITGHTSAMKKAKSLRGSI
jgi:hypothetical protein